MASIVHLVRHAEVANPAGLVYAHLEGFGLSELGRNQAKATARHLASRAIVAVWSSPLQRALDTAGTIATRFGLAVNVADDLGEWRLFDEWAGRPWADVPEDVLRTYRDAPVSLRIGPEPLEALAARMSGAVARLAALHDGEVIVVSHQDPVQAARLALTGGALEALNVDKPGHGTVVTLRPGTPWEEVWKWSPEQ